MVLLAVVLVANFASAVSSSAPSDHAANSPVTPVGGSALARLAGSRDANIDIVSQGASAVVGVALPTSGTPPYSWEWMYESPGSGGFVPASGAECAVPSGTHGAPGASVSCGFDTTRATPPGTYQFELKVTDSATNPESIEMPAPTAVSVLGGPGPAAPATAPRLDADPGEDCTGGCTETNWFAGTRGSGALTLSTAATDELLVLELTDSGQAHAAVTAADVTDTAGSTWTLLSAKLWAGAGNEAYFLYSVDPDSGSVTVTVDSEGESGTTATTATAILAAFSGVDTAAPIAATGTYETGTGDAASAAVTTTDSPTTTLGVLSTQDGASDYVPTASPAFSESGSVNDGAATASYLEYYADTTTGSVTSAPTWTGSVRWGEEAVAIQGASPLSVTVAPTTAVLDVDQQGTFTATPSGGSGGNTYAWSMVSGSCPGWTASTAATQTYTPTATSGSCVLTVTVTDSDADSALPTTSVTLTINSALTAPGAPTVSATALDVNQALTVSGTTPSTGTSPYQYEWLDNSGGGYAKASVCTVASGTGIAADTGESCAVAANKLTAGLTYYFELAINDSATTRASVTSPASAAVVVSSALGAPAAPAVSATALDVDQAFTATATVPNSGSPTYAWQWLASVDAHAFADATVCATNSGSGAAGDATETCAVGANGLVAGDTYEFELDVTDSASTTESATSAASHLVTVSTELEAPGTPSVSATLLDSNQAFTASGTMPTTGTAPYSWAWLISVNGQPFAPASQCATNSGTGAAADAGEACTVAAGGLTAGDNYAFELRATDGASSPETATSSGSSTVTVSPRLTASVAPAPSATSLDVDQPLYVNVTLQPNGTALYSWTWLMSTNGSAFSTATVCTVATGSGAAADAVESCAIPADSLTAGTAYQFEIKVTDSASGPETVTSPASVTVTTSAALAAGGPSPGVPAIDDGQTLTLTSSATGGSGGDVFQWYSGASAAACVAFDAPISGATSATYLAGPSSSEYYCYTVTDSNGVTVGSPADEVDVSPALTLPSTPTVSATALDAGQELWVSASLPSTGTPSYSYEWLVSEDGGTFAAASICATDAGSGAGAGASETCTVAGGTLTPGTTYQFELEVVDSAFSPESTTSPTSASVAVASELTSPSAPSVSATALDSDQALTVNGTIPTTGTAAYRWLWLEQVNGTGPFVSATDCLVSGGSDAAAGDEVSCVLPANTLTPGATYAFELEVADNATSPESATSVASEQVVVNSPLRAPSIVASVDQGPLGALYSVTGAGFGPSGAAVVEFDDVAQTPTRCVEGDPTGTTIATNASGGFDCAFAVPSEPAGAYSIVAENAATHLVSTADSFDVTVPSIAVSPTDGEVGSNVTVSGTGFSVLTALASLDFGSVPIAACLQGSLTSDAAGDFRCTFAVPTGTNGAAVVATDAGGQSASTTFAVTVAPSSGTGASFPWELLLLLVVPIVLIPLVLRRRSRRLATASTPPLAPTGGTAMQETPPTGPALAADASVATGPLAGYSVASDAETAAPGDSTAVTTPPVPVETPSGFLAGLATALPAADAFADRSATEPAASTPPIEPVTPETDSVPAPDGSSSAATEPASIERSSAFEVPPSEPVPVPDELSSAPGGVDEAPSDPGSMATPTPEADATPAGPPELGVAAGSVEAPALLSAEVVPVAASVMPGEVPGSSTTEAESFGRMTETSDPADDSEPNPEGAGPANFPVPAPPSPANIESLPVEVSVASAPLFLSAPTPLRALPPPALSESTAAPPTPPSDEPLAGPAENELPQMPEIPAAVTEPVVPRSEPLPPLAPPVSVPAEEAPLPAGPTASVGDVVPPDALATHVLAPIDVLPPDSAVQPPTAVAERLEPTPPPLPTLVATSESIATSIDPSAPEGQESRMPVPPPGATAVDAPTRDDRADSSVSEPVADPDARGASATLPWWGLWQMRSRSAQAKSSPSASADTGTAAALETTDPAPLSDGTTPEATPGDSPRRAATSSGSDQDDRAETDPGADPDSPPTA